MLNIFRQTKKVLLYGDSRTSDDCSVQLDLGAKLWFWHRLIWSHLPCVTVDVQLVLEGRFQTHCRGLRGR